MNPQLSCVHFPTIIAFQITCFVGCAVAQGVALARWRKWSAEEKARGWPLYGWFTALCCIGSVTGAIAFAARVAQFSQRFPRQRIEQIVNKTDYEFQLVSEYYVAELRQVVLHFFFFPFELGFVTVSQLLILYRMQQFSMSRLLQRRAYTLLARVFLAAVSSGVVAGICGNAAGVKYLSDAIDLHVKSVAAFAAGDIDNAKALQLQAKAIESYGAWVSPAIVLSPLRFARCSAPRKGSFWWGVRSMAWICCRRLVLKVAGSSSRL